jgi:acylphosphatase
MGADRIIEVKVIFSGTVQGVNFRYTAKRHAESIGIEGTISNLDNDTVEMRATGSESNIYKLIDILKNERFPIQVTDVKVTEILPVSSYVGFQIVR